MRPESLIGQQLAGKYTLDALLGVGGFGAVYRARQAPIDRVVAVKVNLHSHRSDLQARFLREAKLQAELRHPGCVMLLDCGETDGLFYLVQEFVEGHSLGAELARGPLGPARAVDIVGQVLAALGEAHRHNIVHRDIKPGNVMLTRGRGGAEEVRVLDFGIAKLLVDDGEDEESLTGTGVSLGTPAYMAPEQIRPGPIGPPTDVYAVGAMLYRLVTGRAVFSGATIDVLTQQLNDPPPPLPPQLAALDPIIARAMAKPPGERFQSADAMWAALSGISFVGAGQDAAALAPTLTSDLTPLLDGERTAVTPSPPDFAPMHRTPAPAAEEGRTRRAPAVAVGLLLLVAAAVIAWALFGGSNEAPLGAEDAAQPAPDAVMVTAAEDSATLDGAAPDAAGPDRAVDGATPDALVIDAAHARPPADAAPPPPRPARRARQTRPRADARARLEARFAARLAACDCRGAKATLASLEAQPGVDGAALTGRYVRACELLLPDNCTAR